MSRRNYEDEATESPMHVLVIDNYDSFTYNLVQYLGELGCRVEVHRNDQITLGEIEALNPARIVLSPGPGTPRDAGITLEVVKHFAGKIPLLGVCLGHQAIGEAFGGEVTRARELKHGKTSLIYHSGEGLMKGLPVPFEATLYHSLAVRREGLPSCLEVNAWSKDGSIMALQHRDYPVFGVQFHPESILTRYGKEVLKNFLQQKVLIPVHRVRELIGKLTRREDLDQNEAEQALESILSEDCPDVVIGSFLTALSMKGETAREIAGFARVMRQHAIPVQTTHTRIVDTAGTGGGAHTFNISTTAAFVIAGAGLAVAKHGNRAVTSRSGSADVLLALGVNIDAPAEVARASLNNAGIAFMFAPLFHPAMKRVVQVRRQLGYRTIFNLLGPLTNPAAAPFQLIGVYAAELTDVVARALSLLGCRKAWVVYSEDGMDELSSQAQTYVAEVEGDRVRNFELDPTQLGFSRGAEGYPGGTPEENAEITRGILKGTLKGTARDVVILNAAAALHIAGDGDQPLSESVQSAQNSIDSGAAYRKLEELIEAYRGG